MSKKSLTYHFCGSFPSDLANIDILVSNIERVIESFFLGGSKIAIRAVPVVRDTILIDQLIFDVAKRLVREGRIAREQLILIFEDGIESSFLIDFECVEIHSPYSDRIEFYSEILDVSDAVVAVGGAAGVNRLLALSEYSRIPVFVIPGAGGSADEYWKDTLTKSHQSAFLSAEEKLEIKKMLPVNRYSELFGPKTFSTISDIVSSIKAKFPSRSEGIIELQKITIPGIVAFTRRLTWKSWTMILGLISALFSLGVLVGRYLSHG